MGGVHRDIEGWAVRTAFEGSLDFGRRLFNADFPFKFGHFRNLSFPNFYSCLIYQATLTPDISGVNYIFKEPQ